MSCDAPWLRGRAQHGPRVLVSRPDHLGDFLLTLPAIARLRSRLPAASIACMVPPDLTPIAERAADVDEVLAMPLRMTDPPPHPASPANDLASPLRGRFDLALLPRPSDPWSGVLTAAASVPMRVGHSQPATAPFLTHALPEDTSRHVAREAVALADHAAALLGGRLLASAPSPRSNLRLLPEDRARAEEVLAALGLGSAAPVVVHPTAGWRLKTWPVDRWIRLVADIADRLGTSVLVVGRPVDRPLLEAIDQAAGADVRAVDSVSITILAALHAAARFVVGMDSGALHLAAVVGTPVVGLFGPFGPGRVAPIAPASRMRSIWRSLPCSPCGTLEAPPCGAARNPACLSAISPEEVLDGIVQLDRCAAGGSA